MTPAEGQLRSQYLLFKGRARRMREFLMGYARYEERGNGGERLSEEMIVRRMRRRR
jgi:hypothetical protein